MKVTTRINCKVIENEDKKFPVFSAKINGTYVRIKFTKECEYVPNEMGVYTLTFDTLNSSPDRARKYKDKDGIERVSNNTIWIRKIDEIVKYTEEELAEVNARDVENLLGYFKPIDADEPLPF